MTLDEAIQHGEAIATEYEYEIKEFLAVGDEENAGKCIECRDNHVQLINWLKELKDLRILIGGEDNYMTEPPEQADVQPIKRGKWENTNTPNQLRCSRCDVIHFIAQYPHGEINYCPNCGARMDGDTNG